MDNNGEEKGKSSGFKVRTQKHFTGVGIPRDGTYLEFHNLKMSLHITSIIS